MILTSFSSLKFNFCNLLQYSFLNLSSLSIYQANSIYVFREIIFLGDFLANFYNFHFILLEYFCRIRIWFTYRYDALIFVSGPQNVFLVEVWNRNNAHGKFCIPRLRLGYKKKPLALSKFMFNLNAFIIYRTSYSDISFSFLGWYFGRTGNHDLNSSKDDDTRKNATKIC